MLLYSSAGDDERATGRGACEPPLPPPVSVATDMMLCVERAEAERYDGATEELDGAWWDKV